MQLFSDSRDEGDLDRAIAELQRALPVAALQNIIGERRRKHKPSKQLQRYLENAMAAEIRRENISA